MLCCAVHACFGAGGPCGLCLSTHTRPWLTRCCPPAPCSLLAGRHNAKPGCRDVDLLRPGATPPSHLLLRFNAVQCCSLCFARCPIASGRMVRLVGARMNLNTAAPRPAAPRPAPCLAQPVPGSQSSVCAPLKAQPKCACARSKAPAAATAAAALKAAADRAGAAPLRTAAFGPPPPQEGVKTLARLKHDAPLSWTRP